MSQRFSVLCRRRHTGDILLTLLINIIINIIIIIIIREFLVNY